MTRTHVRTLMAAIGITLSAQLMTAAPADAATFTFPAFSQVVDNTPASDLDPETHALPGAPAGMYNAYTFTMDWSPISGDPYSEEAYWAFTDTGDLDTVNTFYADPGSAPNSSGNGTPRTLQWSGYMDFAYAGGDPFYLLMAQDYPGSSANWNNVSISIFDAARNTTNFSGVTTQGQTWRRPATLASLSTLATAVPYEVVPFYVDTNTQYKISAQFPNADGFMTLYEDGFSPDDQLTNLMAIYDDTFFGEAETTVLDLIAGKQYYLVLTGFENSDYGDYFGFISNNDPFALGLATLGLVPEPATLLLVLPALGLWRRRRA